MYKQPHKCDLSAHETDTGPNVELIIIISDLYFLELLL